MLGNQLACDAFTAVEEGGMSTNPCDPGNWTSGKVGTGLMKGTKYGISAAAFPTIDIKNLTPATAAVLRAPYWKAIAGDMLPLGVDLMVYDEAINAGPGRSEMILQKCIGVAPDGNVGPVTLDAVSTKQPAGLIADLESAQAAFYKTLSLFGTYGDGWMARLTRRNALALEMAGVKSAPISSLPAHPGLPAAPSVPAALKPPGAAAQQSLWAPLFAPLLWWR